jgi:hypothetical protein
VLCEGLCYLAVFSLSPLLFKLPPASAGGWNIEGGFSQRLEKAFPRLQPNLAEADRNLFFWSSAKAGLVVSFPPAKAGGN